MTEASPLEFLFGLQQHGVKLGLEKIALLCDALGHPEGSFRSVLVAGTNGKGSVAAIVDTTLQAAGLRTGRFTSPHLVDLEERFCINGASVSRRDLTSLAQVLQNTVGELLTSGNLETPPTFFEATTAIAFMLFQRTGVEVAVLEVGMGGRFDATNIVSPAATAITSVDLDHTQFLGKTLPEIAVEKAGVVRPDGLVVTGETKPQALDVIRQSCRERNARLVEVSQDVSMHVALRDGLTELVMTTPHRTYGPLVLSLRGRHQAHNASIAVRLLEELDDRHPIPKRAIEAGLVRTQWPGRLELIRAGERAWALLDAAHNVAAAAALGRYLEETYPGGLPIILAAMRDKDVAGILQQLKPVASRIVCTAPRNPRAWPAEELLRMAAQHCPGIPRTVADSPATALEEAWQDNETICVAGSVYLIGEVREILVSRTTSFASPPGGPE